MSPLTLATGNTGAMPYDEFLREKVAFDRRFGFEVEPTAVNPILKPHQADIVRWAVAGGRRAIFAKFGLGKSVMQLEILRLILERLGGGSRALIVAPLGVRGEFVRDGRDLLGLEVRFVRRTAEVDPAWSGIYVTNYESVRDGKLAVDQFDAVSLDEAAVLRSFGSKTYQEFLGLFADVPFRFVATATPSPNRHKELIHYAGFLGIMDTGAALTRFFQRDSSQAGNLTLYPHKEREFWLWLNTWACFLQAPSDLGYSDEGYVLPALDVQWHEVAVDMQSSVVERDGQGVLVRGGALGIVDAAREKRQTLSERVARLRQIVVNHWGDVDERGQIILWCDLNDEQAEIEKTLAELGITFSSVHGSLSDDEGERRLDAWRAGETYALIGKPVMLGQGMNLQQCNTVVFVGVTHKFEQTIQAVHRVQRFGQERQVVAHLIYAESETEVRAVLEAKWQEHDALTDTMSDVIREHGLNPANISAELQRAMARRARRVLRRGMDGRAERLCRRGPRPPRRRQRRPDCHVDPVRQPLRVLAELRRHGSHRRQRPLLVADGLPHPVADEGAAAGPAHGRAREGPAAVRVSHRPRRLHGGAVPR
ncbi:hypothetical protein QFZ26_002010 [Agromyces ramosus]|uniref:Helicase C-terminal domain-containing protein n=1 Tax=Agromyces ramosus TaxID=33879 RepID=A0ABU0R8Q3_9MICO|nr:hypothetical protein [Agromyces ramosus]